MTALQTHITDIEYLSQTCQEDTDRLTEELKQCSSNNELLHPTGNIGISIIRHVENARETDVCVGTSTSLGYITSNSCCQADEMFLFDLENSAEIKIEANSIWIEDHICYINTTETINVDVPMFDTGEIQSCSILAFDSSQGKFNEHKLQVETKGCMNNLCTLKIDSNILQDGKILDGTSIACDQQPNLGIITKSENLDNDHNIEFIMITEANFDRLKLSQKTVNEVVEQVYEDVAGFESLRNIFTT